MDSGRENSPLKGVEEAGRGGRFVAEAEAVDLWSGEAEEVVIGGMGYGGLGRECGDITIPLVGRVLS